MDAGFVLALPFHHGDLEPDCVEVLTRGGAYARDKNTSARLCAKNAGGAYARGGAYLRDTTVHTYVFLFFNGTAAFSNRLSPVSWTQTVTQMDRTNCLTPRHYRIGISSSFLFNISIVRTPIQAISFIELTPRQVLELYGLLKLDSC